MVVVPLVVVWLVLVSLVVGGFIMLCLAPLLLVFLPEFIIAACIDIWLTAFEVTPVGVSGFSSDFSGLFLGEVLFLSLLDFLGSRASASKISLSCSTEGDVCSPVTIGEFTVIEFPGVFSSV